MNRYQRGGATNVVLFFVFAFFLLVLVFDKMPASSEAVKALVATADQSQAAQQILKEGLGKTPAPTNQELREIEQKVSQQLVLEQSRAVTGNPFLSLNPVPDTSLAASPIKSDGSVAILQWLLKAGLGLVFLFFLFTLLRWVSRS